MVKQNIGPSLCLFLTTHFMQLTLVVYGSNNILLSYRPAAYITERGGIAM